MIDIQKIYSDYIISSRGKKKKTDKLYRASSSGMCSRKIYYESIEKAEPTNVANEKSQRIMRLGTIVHDDIQRAMVSLNKKS
tara:strand:+ start:297 stop:542 length:246 start_codon:yes stop_codon:yes gene_type:complete